MRDVQILESVVVHIADTRALGPAGVADARLLGHVGETQPAQVAVQVVTRFGSFGLELVGPDQQDVVQPVAVIVEDSGAGAGRFEDVVLEGGRPRDGYAAQARLRGDVPVFDSRCLDTFWQRPFGLGGDVAGSRALTEGGSAQSAVPTATAQRAPPILVLCRRTFNTQTIREALQPPAGLGGAERCS